VLFSDAGAKRVAAPMDHEPAGPWVGGPAEQEVLLAELQVELVELGEQREPRVVVPAEREEQPELRVN